MSPGIDPGPTVDDASLASASTPPPPSGGTGGDEGHSASRRSSRIAELVGRSAVLGGFVVMAAIFAIIEPDTFVTWSTVKNVLDQSAVPVLLASGLTFVLVIGEFDLSFTAIVGLAAGVIVKLVSTGGVPIAPAVIITVVGAGLVGIVVGGFVALGKASSFIVTLAIGSVLTGVELALTDNKTIYQGVPEKYGNLASDSFLGLHLPVWLAIVVLLLGVGLLHGTRFGRHAKAVGENRAAAYMAGLRVRRITIISFVLAATLAGVAAVVLTSRSVSYYPNSSSGFLLNIYAAAFLGAAVGSFSRFTVAGSAVGVVWLTTLQTGLTLHNEPAWTANVIQGIVLAAAVLIASRGRRSAV